MTVIPRRALTGEPSERLGYLARQPKQSHSHYKPARAVQWLVSREAQSHTASERTHKLARPKNRNADLEDYDPKAWTVSRSALNAKATPRLDELATPIPRKVRAKKNA